MILLAKTNRDKVLNVREMAEMTLISSEFLEQILMKLKKAGLVRSQRGPGGGYILEGSPSEISVKDIFDAVGENIDLTPCTSCKESELICEVGNGCDSYLIWKGASEQLLDFFTSVTLQGVLDGKGVDFVS